MLNKKNNDNSFLQKLFIAMSFLILVTSCTDLDENPDEVQLAESSLSSVEALEALVTGSYRKLHDGAQWCHYYLASYGGDDISTHRLSNKEGFRHADWRSQTSISPALNWPYYTSYNHIAVANAAIAGKDIVQGDQAEIDRLIGEAYFLRAFSYLHLTRTFGKVPLQLVSNSNEALFKAEFVDIYAQIESDLKQAETLLPNIYPGIETVGVRPSKGAAKAYLARLYMHWAGFPINDTSKYAMAATKAKEVIDGAYGYSLSDDFRGLWTEAKRFAQSESVFMMVGCTEGCQAGNRATGRLGLTGNAGGWTEMFGEIAFYDDHMAAAAADGTMKRFNDTYILEQIPRGEQPIGANFKTFTNPEDRHPMYRKVVGGDLSETVNTTRNDINRYFMRYADVLLMYAEASGRSGNITADSWEALNMVRRRAAGLPVNTPDAGIDLTSGDIAELAYTERKWELAGEFERWHDLVRMDRVGAALANRSPLEDVDVGNNRVPETGGKYFYFSPIPQSELDIAPQLND